MSEDFAFHPNVLPTKFFSNTLRFINSTLRCNGKTLADYGLKYDDFDVTLDCSQNKELDDKLNIHIPQNHINAASLLNSEQRHAYNTIVERILQKQPGAFFIDGPGGTGKTFLYCALLASIRSKRRIAIATATSGVVAALMPGGRTAHSRFKIPINVDETSTCSISKQSELAELIHTSSLIVWDEASMAKRQAIEALDRMLQDIMDSSLLFSGKVVVFGGDFRQVLPVVTRSTREGSVDASLLKSVLWPLLENFKLTSNVRAQHDQKFSDFHFVLAIVLNQLLLKAK